MGGPPAITLDHTEILKWPKLTDKDADAVLQVLYDGDISKHRVVRRLEGAYADFSRRKYALGHCNGSTAFLTAFHALGLRYGRVYSDA